MATTNLLERRLKAAAANKGEARLFQVLTRHFPTMHSRDIQWAVTDYLELGTPAMEFGDQVAVIPGQHKWMATTQEAAKAGLIDDAVSLDLLWILDDHSVDSIYAVGPVGVIGKSIPVAYGTSRETARRYSAEDHPLVSFDVRDFFEDMYEPREGEVMVMVDQNWPGERKYAVLSLAAFENFNHFAIRRAATRVLTSVTEYVYEFEDPADLARALFKRVHSWVERNPRIEPLYLSFTTIRDLARKFSEDDKESPRRRRIYEYVGFLPDIDDSNPASVKDVTNAEKIFKDGGEGKGEALSAPPKSATVLPFKREAEKHCALCEAQMQLRHNRRNGKAFWGCSNFPKCRHTESAA